MLLVLEARRIFRISNSRPSSRPTLSYIIPEDSKKVAVYCLNDRESVPVAGWTKGDPSWRVSNQSTMRLNKR